MYNPNALQLDESHQQEGAMFYKICTGTNSDVTLHYTYTTICQSQDRTTCSLCKLQCSLDSSCLLSFAFANQWNRGPSIILPGHGGIFHPGLWGNIFLFLWRQVLVSIIWKLLKEGETITLTYVAGMLYSLTRTQSSTNTNVCELSLMITCQYGSSS